MKSIVLIGLVAVLATAEAATTQNRFDVARKSTTHGTGTATTAATTTATAAPAIVRAAPVALVVDRTPVATPATKAQAPVRIATRIIRVDRRLATRATAGHVNYWDAARWTVIGRRSGWKSTLRGSPRRTPSYRSSASVR